MFRIKIILLVLALNSFAFALTPNQIQKLSQEKRWSELLQYRTSIWGTSKSEVRSPNFFLSADGQTNLLSELESTMKAMAEPINADLNRHAQCRFPARLIWLEKMLPDMAATWPQVTCPDYLKFSHQGYIKSISFLFATGYLSNPASYFGHPLIKFNLSSNENRPSTLLDVSVNFGAVTPANENSFVYAAKGLFGGYDATFTHRQFYYNNHAYGEVELRDMWEYRLNLKPDEVEYFYSHIWELIGKKFPYFFLSNNCATASAHFLEDAVGIKMMPSYLPYSLPYTFFDHLADSRRADGTPLVESIKLIPSRQSRLTAHFKKLNEPQKDAVRKIAEGQKVDQTLSVLPTEDKSAVIETLFDYYSFVNLQDRKTAVQDQVVDSTKRELLVERLRLPKSKERDTTEYDLRDPLEGPRPFLLRLSSNRSLTFGSGAEFNFRMAYYDFLSLDYGRPKNSEVRALDATFVVFDQALWMKKIDLISVTTLNVSQTGLPHDGGLAWRFTTGFEKLNLLCRDCDIFRIESGFGKAVTLLDRWTIYTVLDFRGQTATSGAGQLAATSMVGSVISWFPSGWLNTEMSFGYRRYLENDSANASILKVDNRLGLSREWDLRASYEKHVDEWYSLGLSWYL